MKNKTYRFAAALAVLLALLVFVAPVGADVVELEVADGGNAANTLLRVVGTLALRRRNRRVD